MNFPPAFQCQHYDVTLYITNWRCASLFYSTWSAVMSRLYWSGNKHWKKLKFLYVKIQNFLWILMALISLIMSHHCLWKHESNFLFVLETNFYAVSKTLQQYHPNLHILLRGFNTDNSLKAAFTSLSCLKIHSKNDGKENSKSISSQKWMF